MQLEVSLVVVARRALDGRLLAQRHDHHLRPGAREPAEAQARSRSRTILNRSINETLPRSVLTHGTTLSTLLALAIFGGEVIRPFALVMFFGVFTGTFSSIYIASPVLMCDREAVAGRARARAPGAAAPQRRAPAPGRRTEARSRSARTERPGTAARPPMLIDTHCHLADPAYDADRRRGAATGRGRRASRTSWSSASRRTAAERALALAAAEPRLSATAGVHPHDASRLDRRDRATGSASALARPAGRGRRRDGPRLPLRSFAPRRAARRLRGPARPGRRGRQAGGHPRPRGR